MALPTLSSSGPAVARPVVPNLGTRMFLSWIRIPISPTQHCQWPGLMGCIVHGHLESAGLGVISSAVGQPCLSQGDGMGVRL